MSRGALRSNRLTAELPTALPRTPGTYVLLIVLDRSRTVRPGRLGRIDLSAGLYLYFGSALGGIAARVERHLRAHKSLHWHIDALTSAARPEEVWWVESGERLECHWARTALAVEGVEAPVRGFGSSDCRCESHLVRVPAARDLARVRLAIEASGRPLGPGSLNRARTPSGSPGSGGSPPRYRRARDADHSS